MDTTSLHSDRDVTRIRDTYAGQAHWATGNSACERCAEFIRNGKSERSKIGHCARYARVMHPRSRRLRGAACSSGRARRRCGDDLLPAILSSYGR